MKSKYLLWAISILVIISIFALSIFLYLDFKENDKSLSALKKRGVLVVGSDIPYGSMEFIDNNNQAAGVDVDIAKEIAAHLGVTLEFRDYGWDELFSRVNSGEVDLAISSITITPERKEELLFSDPYFSGGQVIVTLSDDNLIKGINDLANEKVGVQKDTTSYSEAEKYTPEDLIYSYSDFEKKEDGILIINDLNSGKIKAIIVDYVQALDLIKNDQRLKIVGIPFTKENYGVATKLGNNLLMKEVNSILDEMQSDGHLQEIKIKWTRY